MPRLPSGPPRDRNDNEVLPWRWDDEAHEARWAWAQKLIDASAQALPGDCVGASIGYEARKLPDLVGWSRVEPDATEVLMLNAAFYRYEMHNKRPPPSLCVDIPRYGMRLERTEPPVAFDAYNPERARIAHADLRDNSFDTIRCVTVREYDALLVFVRHELPALERRKPSETGPGAFLRDMNAEQDRVLQKPTASSRKTKPAWWCNPQRLLARKRDVALQALITHNRRPSVPFEQGRDSRVEALHRMLQVLSLYFLYERSAVYRALPLMRFRAHVMAFLRLRANRLRLTLQQLRPVVRAPSPLVRVVREGASDELGQALWPYVHWDDSHAIMCTCKTLHAWGREFSRQLQLRLVVNAAAEPVTAANLPRSGTDPDGTPLLSITKTLKLGLEFYYEVDEHVDLAPIDWLQPSQTHANRRSTIQHVLRIVPNPGTNVVEECSALTVELVRDDRPDGPAVYAGVCEAAPRVSSFVHALKRTRHSVHRTSREVGGSRDTKLRLRFTAHVATRSSLRRAKERDSRRAMAARYTALTPAFRVVVRYATARAREAERGRKQALAAARRAAGQAMVELAAQNSARAHAPPPDPDPETAHDPLALDADALDALLGEGD